MPKRPDCSTTATCTNSSRSSSGSRPSMPTVPWPPIRSASRRWPSWRRRLPISARWFGCGRTARETPRPFRRPSTRRAGNAMIQIEEVGPWTEQIVVPAEKDGTHDLRQEGPLARHYHGRRPKQLRRKLPGPVAAVVVGKAGDRPCRFGRTARCCDHRGNGRSFPSRGRVRAYMGRQLMRSRALCMPASSQRDAVAQGQRLFRADRFQGVLFAAECLGLRRRRQLRRRLTICGIARSAGLSTWPACSGTVTDCIVHSINAPTGRPYRSSIATSSASLPYENGHPGQGLPQGAAAVCRPEEFRLPAASGQSLPQGRIRRQRHGLHLHERNQALLKVAADLRNRARGKL